MNSWRSTASLRIHKRGVCVATSKDPFREGEESCMDRQIFYENDSNMSRSRSRISYAIVLSNCRFNSSDVKASKYSFV